MEAYDVFSDAANTNAMKVVISSQDLAKGRSKSDLGGLKLPGSCRGPGLVVRASF